MVSDNQVGFEDMPLGPALRQALQEVGYRQPTPIQAEFIPPAMQGTDLIGQAQTGTGKTAAFLIPILHRMEPLPVPQALVLGPTRELIHQVRDEAVRLAAHSGVRIAAIYGGQHLHGQISELQRGVQLVVGTPGRVLDMMRRGCLRMDKIRCVVLDEADRMLDIGFRPDIEKILQKTPRDRQTLMLSATVPPPVQRLAQRYMRDPKNIILSADEIAVDTIEQRLITVDDDRKFPLLLRLLVREKPRQCLIFCQMRSSVRDLAQQLGRRVRGVMEMQGDLPQEVRNRVMRDFREGLIRILVATDVVGRGIDVQGISHVINYDIPEDPEVYVHRIGRTGRMGKDGKAFLLVTPDQGQCLTDIEVFMNQEIAPDSIEGFAAVRSREKPASRPSEAAAPKDDRPRLGRNGKPVVANRYRDALGLA